MIVTDVQQSISKFFYVKGHTVLKTLSKLLKTKKHHSLLIQLL